MKINRFLYIGGLILAIFLQNGITQNQISLQNKQQQLRIAQEYENLGDFTQALSIYEQIHQSNPDDPLAFDGIKRIFSNQKRFAELITLIEKQLQRRYDLTLETELGTAYYKSGKEKEAHKLWSQILEKSKHSLDAYHYVAQEMIENRLYDEATALYLEGRKKNSRHELFTLELANLFSARLDYSNAANEYLNYLRINPRQYPYIESSINRLIENEPDIVQNLIEIVRKKTTETPNDTNLRKLLVNFYLNKRDYENGFAEMTLLDQLESGLKNNPQMGQSLFEFGTDLLHAGAYIYAERAFNLLIQKYPQSPMADLAQLGLARTFQLQNNHDQALMTYQELIARSKNTNQTQEALFEIAEVKLNQQFDPPGARSAYQQILKSSKGGDRYYRALFGIGDSFFAEGRLTDAREWYSKPLKQAQLPFKDRMTANYKLALIDVVAEKFDAAQNKLNEIITQASSQHQQEELVLVNDALDLSLLLESNATDAALKLLAKKILLQKQNKIQDSINLLLEIVQKYPQSNLLDRVIMELGELYSLSRDYVNSIKSFQRLITEFPKSNYCDIAKFKIGEIYEIGLGNHPQAIKEYEEFLMQYPRSIYLEDVRRKIRSLERNL
ncbi:tetratricopeptide repeat protein [candidate division KSB1 bacterium]|nr:tetratricopeptide repeat protein [candidate division KSB1 bacterium]